MGIAVHVYRYRSGHDQPQGVLEARAFAEQFAHVGTAISAIFKLYTYPDYIDNMRRKFMTVVVGSRLDARQELRLMKSRFEVPPYLFKELDNYLRPA